jgi:hypothetical protein
MVETKQKEKIASSEKLRNMASKYESKGDLAKAEALKNIAEQNDFAMDLLDRIPYGEGDNNIEVLNRLGDSYLQENKEVSEQFYKMAEDTAFMLDLADTFLNTDETANAPNDIKEDL